MKRTLRYKKKKGRKGGGKIIRANRPGWRRVNGEWEKVK